jgi:hypothetical protein
MSLKCFSPCRESQKNCKLRTTQFSGPILCVNSNKQILTTTFNSVSITSRFHTVVIFAVTNI